LIDLYYKLKYKKAIQGLGLGNKSAENICIPIKDSWDNSLNSRFYLVIKKERIIFLIKKTFIKNNKDRVIMATFLKWLNIDSDAKYIKLNNSISLDAPDLYFFLKNNFMGTNTGFTFICNECDELFEFMPDNKENCANQKSRYGFIKREKKADFIYDTICCPHNHQIYYEHWERPIFTR
jgi:hypothetical protein